MLLLGPSTDAERSDDGPVRAAPVGVTTTRVRLDGGPTGLCLHDRREDGLVGWGVRHHKGLIEVCAACGIRERLIGHDHDGHVAFDPIAFDCAQAKVSAGLRLSSCAERQEYRADPQWGPFFRNIMNPPCDPREYRLGCNCGKSRCQDSSLATCLSLLRTKDSCFYTRRPTQCEASHLVARTQTAQ